MVTLLSVKEQGAKRLNPYSNGTMYLMVTLLSVKEQGAKRLNPYSNGTMYLMR